MTRVAWRQALAWRVNRHFLSTRTTAAELSRVAGALCGLHAQIQSSPGLSLLARIQELPPEAVEDALWRRRSLVKLWSARGTLHLLPAADLGMWLGALRTQKKFGNAGHPKVEQICAAVGRALDGQVLTRAELAAEVGRSTGSAELATWVGSSWGSDLKAASFRGLICFASPKGREVRFTSPATWTRAACRVQPAESAIREVTRRFLAAYAPATPESIARWWVGPPKTTVGMRMLATLGDEAVPVEVGGRAAWALAEDVAELRTATAPETCRLLPAFDPWIIGAFREPPLIPTDRVRDVFRPQGRFSPVVLVDGRVVGRWEHRRTGGSVALAITPYGRVGRRVRAALESEAQRVAGYLGGALELSWSSR